MAQLTDISANLLDPMFHGIYRGKRVHDDDFAAVLSRATESGVSRMIVTAGTLAESREALNLVRSQPGGLLYSTAGVHPTRCQEFEGGGGGGGSAMIESLAGLIASSGGKIVALGELGLDADRTHFCPMPTQLKWFEAQLSRLAGPAKLPLFLHSRSCKDSFLEVMTRTRTHWESSGGVVHSFTGTADELRQELSLGLHIGVNGCSLKTRANLDVIRLIPLDRLLLETDCPWCDIRPTHASWQFVGNAPARLAKWPECRGERFRPGCRVKSRSEPCNLVEVLSAVSALLQVAPEVVAEKVRANTDRLFFGKS